MANLLTTSSPDPFTLVYCALWDMLENSKAFVDLVQKPNRIKWLGQNRDPRKDQATNSDRPEIRIDPGYPFAMPDMTTGTSKLTTRWDILAATDCQPLDLLGSNGLGGAIMPVLWAIYTSLIGYRQNIKALTFNGALFVYKVQPGLPVVSIDNSKSQQGLVGWTAGWSYEVMMEFNTLAIMPSPVN